MKRISLRPICLTLGLTLSVSAVGCASGGAGASSSFRRDIGQVMEAPVTLARDKIFDKYHIPMLREETTSRAIYWETQWMPRDPSPEEMVAGVIGGRNRIIMRGTYSEQRLDGTLVFRMRYEVENEVQTQMDPAWHPGTIPPVVEERFKEVYDDLMMELRAGVIR